MTNWSITETNQWVQVYGQNLASVRGHVKTKSYLRWDTDWSKQITGCQSKLPGQCSLTQSYQGWNKITTNQGTQLDNYKELVIRTPSLYINVTALSLLRLGIIWVLMEEMFGSLEHNVWHLWDESRNLMLFSQVGRQTHTNMYSCHLSYRPTSEEIFRFFSAETVQHCFCFENSLCPSWTTGYGTDWQNNWLA